MTAAADRKAAREAAEAVKADADVSPPAAVDAAAGTDAPAKASEGAGGDLHRYRAHRAMAGVNAGEHFDASQDDPRVASGYVTDLGMAGQVEVPDEVQEAFDGKGDPAVSA